MNDNIKSILESKLPKKSVWRISNSKTLKAKTWGSSRYVELGTGYHTYNNTPNAEIFLITDEGETYSIFDLESTINEEEVYSLITETVTTSETFSRGILTEIVRFLYKKYGVDKALEYWELYIKKLSELNDGQPVEIAIAWDVPKDLLPLIGHALLKFSTEKYMTIRKSVVRKWIAKVENINKDDKKVIMKLVNKYKLSKSSINNSQFYDASQSNSLYFDSDDCLDIAESNNSVLSELINSIGFHWGDYSALSRQYKRDPERVIKIITQYFIEEYAESRKYTKLTKELRQLKEIMDISVFVDTIDNEKLRSEILKVVLTA